MHGSVRVLKETGCLKTPCGDLVIIDTAINHIATSVNQQLMRTFGLNEEVVVVSNILEQDGTVATHVSNKIVVSLVNIEKDTAAITRQRASRGRARSRCTPGRVEAS